MNRVLALAAVSEAATGLALVIVPSLVGQLLLGAGLSGVSIVVGRVAGIGLLSLGLACWPGNEATRSALRAMTVYNLLVTLYLLSVGIRSDWVGPLLWPVVAIHGVLSSLLARLWLKAGKSPVRESGGLSTMRSTT